MRSGFVRRLPSLLNVLAGQMSIVGPHPTTAGNGSVLEQSGHLRALRPGLTGLWRQTEDAAEQLLLDLQYLRSYSVWLDLQILFDRIKVRLDPGSRRQRVLALEGRPVRLMTGGGPLTPSPPLAPAAEQQHGGVAS